MCTLLGWSRDVFTNICLWAHKKDTLPNEIAEIVLCHWKACMKALEKAKVPIQAITYETLVEDPEKTVLDLVQFFGLSENYKEDMIKAMKIDSQEGTRISWKYLLLIPFILPF